MNGIGCFEYIFNYSNYNKLLTMLDYLLIYVIIWDTGLHLALNNTGLIQIINVCPYIMKILFALAKINNCIGLQLL